MGSCHLRLPKTPVCFGAVLACLVVAPNHTLAAVLRVPSDYLTIGSAVQAAANGDTVLVAPGTYTGEGNRNIDFEGKDLVVRSEVGAASTFIDLQVQGRAFILQNWETSAARVEGLTIRNGSAPSGGAAYCTNSTPTFLGCIFLRNRASTGGGIHCLHSSPRLVNCAFIENEAVMDGGGVSSDDAEPRVTNCSFIENSAYLGGGMACNGYLTEPLLVECTFERNSAQLGGGLAARVILAANACLFKENVAVNGAGAWWQGQIAFAPPGSVARFADCIFTGNAASGDGGGLCALPTGGVSIELERCVLIGNSAARGGGIYNELGIDIRSCSLVENGAPSGGGIFYSWFGTIGPWIERSIIAFSTEGPAFQGTGSTCAYLECSDLFGNAGGDYVGCLAGQLGANGNMRQDPLFCDREDGDLRLSSESPCAPAHSPAGCDLIGTFPVACAPASVSPDLLGMVPSVLEVNPNPVRSGAELHIYARGTSLVEINDVKGRLLERLPVRSGRTIWRPGTVLPSGVYFVRSAATRTSAAVKVVVVQ